MTAEQNKHPLEDRLVYEHDVPVMWEVFEPASQTALLSNINHNNEILLHVLLSLDDGGVTKEHDEHVSEYTHELQRLDAKLNLLLQWFGQWLAETKGMPEKHKLRLSDSGLALAVSETMTKGTGVLFHVYLSEQYPQALQLPCEVYNMEHSETGATVVATFTGLSAEARDLIEKFIFREHRRLIAASKRRD